METAYREDIARAFGLTPEQLDIVTEQEKKPAQIVPDNVQDELIMLRDKKRDIYFRIGDIANELVLLHKGTISNMKVYKAMTPYCDASARTIRYYAENASFYAPSVRAQYDCLPFSHFDLARNYGECWEWVIQLGAEHPGWSRKYLEKCANAQFMSMGENNSDPQESVYDSVLTGEIKFTDGETEAFFENTDFGISVVEYDAAGRPCAIGPLVPKRPKMNSARLVGEIASLSEKVIELLDRYGGKIPKELKDRLVEHLVGINSEIPAITVALDEDRTK